MSVVENEHAEGYWFSWSGIVSKWCQ